MTRPRTLESAALAAALVPAPFGPVALVCSERGLRRVVLQADQRAEDVAAARGPSEAGAPSAAARRHLQRARAALERYLAGDDRAFDELELDLDDVSPFERAVYTSLREVPFGCTTSYGALAAEAGRPGAARAVGGAMGRNPLPLAVPCHRVLAAGGRIGGFTGGLDLKRALLRFERGEEGGSGQS